MKYFPNISCERRLLVALICNIAVFLIGVGVNADRVPNQLFMLTVAAVGLVILPFVVIRGKAWQKLLAILLAALPAWVLFVEVTFAIRPNR